MREYAILSALPRELVFVHKLLQCRKSEVWKYFAVESGLIEEKKVITLATGAGKVRAAAGVQFIIDCYKPTALLFIGAAGALKPEIEPGEVVVGEKIIEHDFDITALAVKGRQEMRSWKPDQILLIAAIEACQRAVGTARVRTGTILTGDQVIVNLERRDQLRKIFDGDCIEMEGAAVANICSHNKVPFVIIRIVSDSADHNARAQFFGSLSDFIASDSALIVHELLKKDLAIANYPST